MNKRLEERKAFYDEKIPYQFSKKLVTTVVDQITYQIYNNWRVKVPEEDKERIKNEVYRAHRPYIDAKVQQFK